MGVLKPDLRALFHKCENRGRRPRFSYEGGEEKSPYRANCSRRSGTLLDGEHTIPLSPSDNHRLRSLPIQRLACIKKA